MADIYQGGIPTPGKNLFPVASSEGELNYVPGAGGSGDMEPTKGGPATFSGSNNSDDFLTEAPYTTAKDPMGMDIRSEGFGMKTNPSIVNPNDVKNNC